MLSWYYYQGAAPQGRPARPEPDPTRPDPDPMPSARPDRAQKKGDPKAAQLREILPD
jgi:hypothetical protein